MIDKYILGLSNFITGCETPLTLAIQGDWGTGKTSIMYQVEEKLKEKSSSNSKRKIKTIFFNTWQYSQFDMDKDLAVTLITDLIDELEVTDVDKRENFKKSLAVITKSMEYLKLDFGLLNIEKINNNKTANEGHRRFIYFPSSDFQPALFRLRFRHFSARPLPPSLLSYRFFSRRCFCLCRTKTAARRRYPR